MLSERAYTPLPLFAAVWGRAGGRSPSLRQVSAGAGGLGSLLRARTCLFHCLWSPAAALASQCHHTLPSAAVPWLPLPCRLIDPLKDKLESYIYDNGVTQLRRELCFELTRLCSMHQLYDSGEL